jgi:hypothetical protein
MSEAEFTKLYKYLDDRFAEIHQQFTQIHEDNDKILHALLKRLP